MVACVVVPILAYFFLREYIAGHQKLASVPSLQQILMGDSHVLTAKILVLLYFVMSYFAFFSRVFKSHWMMEKYVLMQAVLTATLMGFGLFVVCKYFVFDWIRIFGYKSYLSMNWTDIIKQIHLSEFSKGLLTCVAGKYDQSANLSRSFTDLNCPISQKLESTTTSANLVSELWELKLDE